MTTHSVRKHSARKHSNDPAHPVQMVKNLAAAKGFIRRKEAKNSLELTESQVDSAFNYLCEQGYFERIERGLYRFIEHVDKPVTDTNEKIWRAMKMKRSFSASDIVASADTTVPYVYKLFRKFRIEGHLKQAGARHTYGSGKEKLWRLTLKGKNKARMPQIETFAPNSLVLATLQLDRLVYSELVVRNKESADQACVLLDQIKTLIQEINEETSE